MNRFLENLKHQAEENPVFALGVAAGLITAISQLVNASSNKQNARSWDRETARREKKDIRKS
jgi:hypothetical protein